MKARENQTNLQMWVDDDFIKRLKQTAKESGFIRWQSFAEALFILAINGDIQVSPPTLIKQKPRK